MFDWLRFGEICMSVLPIMLIGAPFFTAFMGAIASRSTQGFYLTVFLNYIFFLGVVVHEAAHYLFCRMFGLKVREVSWFNVENGPGKHQVSFGGYVDTDEVDSITIGAFVGLAPLIINGLLIAVIIYFDPLLIGTDYHWLSIFFGISLALGARPSRQDLSIFLKAAGKAPGRALLEFIAYFTFSAMLYCMILFWQVEWWAILISCVTFLCLMVMVCRVKHPKEVGGFRRMTNP